MRPSKSLFRASIRSSIRTSRWRPVPALWVAVLAGCVSVPTPYAPSDYQVVLPGVDAGPVSQDSRYGYSDAELTDKLVRVTFRGNASTSALRAIDFALLRSAEVALERGYPYFVIRERLDGSRQRTTSTTSTGIPSTSCDSKGHCHTTYSAGVTTSQTFVWPNLEYIVEVFAELPADETTFALDAAFVQRSIREKYELGGSSQ